MTKEKAPDLTGMQITKLPPGRAYGAGDLTNWSHNRARGLSGTKKDETKAVLLACRKCGTPRNVMVSRYTKPRHMPKHDCPTCGGKQSVRWVGKGR